MKKLIHTSLALALALNITHAQDKLELLQKNTWPVSSISLKDTSDDDLKYLAEAIGNSRIVMLGGMDQNDGETIRAKARIIRFLHQRLGFSVLAFPSDFYGTNMMWDANRRGDSMAPAMPASLATTAEFGHLQEYISASNGANKLEITGYSNELAMQNAIPNFFAKAKACFKELGYNSSDPSYNIYLQSLVQATDPKAALKMPDTTFGFLKYTTKMILDDVKKKPSADRFGFISQSLRNFLGTAYQNWQFREDQGRPDVTIADRQMASNLLWIADQKYASRKIIVWADNKHISRNNETIEILVNNTPRKTQATTMGNELTRVFGGELFTIGFSSMNGKTIDHYADTVEIASTGRNDWFTNTLNSSGFQYAFSDFRTIGAHENLDAFFVMRAWNYQQEMKGDWFRVYDGMFFIKTNSVAKTFKLYKGPEEVVGQVEGQRPEVGVNAPQVGAPVANRK